MPSKKTTRPKIVSIAGGTGRYSTLKGLKHKAEITALYNVTDSGGSSGILRVEHGVLPPGDGMRTLAALSKSKDDELFLLDRYSEGRISGHRIANLMYETASRKFGGDVAGINYLEKLFEVEGHILPVSLTKGVNLIAHLADGSTLEGEHEIDVRGGGSPIVSMELRPEARVLPEVVEVIARSDVVMLGPGDLWTSIVPHLLVKGLLEAICASSAKVILICNLFTKPGETDAYKASDFAKVIVKYLGKKIDDLIVNSNGLDQAVKEGYQKGNQQMVKVDEKAKEYAVNVYSDFKLAAVVESEGKKVVRHDSQSTAKAVLRVLAKEGIY